MGVAMRDQSVLPPCNHRPPQSIVAVAVAVAAAWVADAPEELPAPPDGASKGRVSWFTRPDIPPITVFRTASRGSLESNVR